MALIKCKECGKEISKKAEACPNCGAVQKKKFKRPGCLGTLIGIVLLAIGIGWMISDGMSGAEQSSSVETEKKEVSGDIKEIISKANEAYDNDDYATALTEYQKAIDAGTNDGIVWYRYAYSTAQTKGMDLALYGKAYKLLNTQEPDHKYAEYARDTLIENSPELDYRKGALKEYETGRYFKTKGEVFQLVSDKRIQIMTKWDEFAGYYEDYVLIKSEEELSVLAGDIIECVGEYQGTAEFGSYKAPILQSVLLRVVEEN